VSTVSPGPWLIFVGSGAEWVAAADRVGEEPVADVDVPVAALATPPAIAPVTSHFRARLGLGSMGSLLVWGEARPVRAPAICAPNP
jgi:hypothetical protein